MLDHVCSQLLEGLVERFQNLGIDLAGEPGPDEVSEPIVVRHVVEPLDRHELVISGKLAYAGKRGSFDANAAMVENFLKVHPGEVPAHGDIGRSQEDGRLAGLAEEPQQAGHPNETVGIDEGDRGKIHQWRGRWSDAPAEGVDIEGSRTNSQTHEPAG